MDSPFSIQMVSLKRRTALVLPQKLRNFRPQSILTAEQMLWSSREAPPCHITVIGLRHPLREPYVPLSEYTALLLLVQTKLTFLWIILRWQSLHTTSVFLCLAIIAISHRSLPFRFLSLLMW